MLGFMIREGGVLIVILEDLQFFEQVNTQLTTGRKG